MVWGGLVRQCPRLALYSGRQVSGDRELLNRHLCLPWSGQVLIRFSCAATTSPSNSPSTKVGRIRSGCQLGESLRQRNPSTNGNSQKPPGRGVGGPYGRRAA